ncbi:MAG: sigma-70 family RNA polymerase sigma factor [Phycisphaeraceae bacterium]|nr:MAG: sigma-70 family RNA polymerase sigma factor [Phycisphaeraceae bacterium]
MTPELAYGLVKSTYFRQSDEWGYWNQWVHEHEHHWVRIIASRGVFSVADREVVLADSLFKMYCAVRAGHFLVREPRQTAKDLLAYCDQIVRNTAIDAVKARARELRRRRGSINAADEGVQDAREALENELRARLVREVLPSLSGQARKYLFLHVVLDLSVREISDILAEPPATVHGRIKSAKDEFRRGWGNGEAGVAI